MLRCRKQRIKLALHINTTTIKFGLKAKNKAGETMVRYSPFRSMALSSSQIIKWQR